MKSRRRPGFCSAFIDLTGILGASSLLLGVFLGGGRAVVRRLRGKPVSSLNDEDFISLKLG